MTRKIAIVVGHNAKKQGAVRVTDGRTEYDWNSDLARMIRTYDPHNIKVFHRKSGLKYWNEIDEVYARVNDFDPALSMELHFNGNANAGADGCEMYSSGTSGSLRLAGLMQEFCLDALGIDDRGVKVLGRKDRGGRSLWQGRAPAVLTEPYFGSNRDDCKAATENMVKLAKAHYVAAKMFIGDP